MLYFCSGVVGDVNVNQVAGISCLAISAVAMGGAVHQHAEDQDSARSSLMKVGVLFMFISSISLLDNTERCFYVSDSKGQTKKDDMVVIGNDPVNQLPQKRRNFGHLHYFGGIFVRLAISRPGQECYQKFPACSSARPEIDLLR